MVNLNYFAFIVRAQFNSSNSFFHLLLMLLLPSNHHHHQVYCRQQKLYGIECVISHSMDCDVIITHEIKRAREGGGDCARQEKRGKINEEGIRALAT